MIYKILLGFTVVLLGISLYSAYEIKTSKDKEIELYKTQLQKDFKEKYLSIERELKSSELVRHTLVTRCDSFDLVNKTLSERITAGKKELSNIKGKFTNLTSQQKADKMIEEYEKAVSASSN